MGGCALRELAFRKSEGHSPPPPTYSLLNSGINYNYPEVLDRRSGRGLEFRLLQS